MVFDLDLIKKVYAEMPAKVDAARKSLGRPLTLAEKILYAHLWKGVEIKDFERGKSLCGFCTGPGGHAGCNCTNGPACSLILPAARK
jgi:hypothetical protein